MYELPTWVILRYTLPHSFSPKELGFGIYFRVYVNAFSSI